MASAQFYLQIFIYSVVVLCALYMALTIRKRTRSRLSNTLIVFFAFIAIGTSFSVVARLITDIELKSFFIILVPVVVGCSIPQITFFLLILRVGSESYSIAKQVIYTLIYFGILLVLYFIPGGSTFLMDESGSMQPVWSLEFMLYGVIVQQLLFSYVIYLYIVNRRLMQDPEAKKKFSQIIYAIIIFDYILLGTFVVNYFNNLQMRSIFAITGLLVFIALYLLYNGLGKQLKKNT
jgi:hypothetical protein